MGRKIPGSLGVNLLKMLSETLHTTLSRLHFFNFSASNHSEKWNIIWWLMKLEIKLQFYCQLKLSVLFWDILLIHLIRSISCIFLPLRDFNLWSSYFIVAYMFLALINREDYTQTKPCCVLEVLSVNGILTRSDSS